MEVQHPTESHRGLLSKSVAKPIQELAILILAGGDSERLGCRKAFYKVNGKIMIKHVFDRTTNLSREVVISCKLGREELKAMFPTARVTVDKSGEKGPLIGMMDALPEISADYVAVLACDCPMVKPEVVEFMFRCAEGHDGALLRWPNGYMEPLQAVYRTKLLLGAAESARKNGRNKLGDVVDSLDDVVYLTPDELKRVDSELESFMNINSRDDLSKHRWKF